MSNLLKTPGYIITGASPNSILDNRFHFDFAEYDWKNRPASQGNRASMPICWTRDQAYYTLFDLYPDVDSFAALSEGNVLADPNRFMKTGRQIKRPKAILIGNVLTAFGLMTPEQAKITEMREELELNGIFATRISNSVSVNPHTLLRMGLLWKETIMISEPSLPTEFEALDIDVNQSLGGEVLFIFSEFGFSSHQIVPYYSQVHMKPLPVLRAREKPLFQAMIPKFHKFKILYLNGTYDLLTSQAKTALESFISETFTPATFEHWTHNNLIYKLGSFEEPGFAPAKVVVETAIRDFFQLA